MSKLPILNELIKYHKEENLILSMPGNKCGKGFLRDDIGKIFKESLGSLDITEVEPLDNLHHPEGIIKEAQELLAKAYKVKKAYFLVNGSSSGNLASIFAAFNEGDEVLVERNCHKSIYNGLILRKLKPIYINTDFDFENEILLPCTKENIKEAYKKSKNPKGIILTSPNYYGVSSDIKDILLEFKNTGLKIIIDSAHGAHYSFNKDLPKGLWTIADYTVVSAHKTLPALTQGAYLLVNAQSDIEFYISTFNTTSPSYLIMASLDYARYYLEKYGDKDYKNLLNLSNEFSKKINSLNKVKILNQKDLNNKYIIDNSRYILTLPKGHSGGKLLEYLRSEKIQCEMNFSRGVVLLLSPFNTKEDFNKIYNAIKKLNIESLSIEEKNIFIEEVSKIKILEPFEVHNLDFESIEVKDSIGYISKDFIVPYPPGIPLLLPGEKITKEVAQIIDKYKSLNINVLGVENENIKIIKE